MKGSLLEDTINLLQLDKGCWPTTAAATGLGREWIAKLASGAISDPGVRKIEKLHAYLAEKHRTPDRPQMNGSEEAASAT